MTTASGRVPTGLTTPDRRGPAAAGAGRAAATGSGQAAGDGVRFRRIVAAAAALSAGLHLVLAADHGGVVFAMAMAAMACACLPCALHLWRAPSPKHVWAVLAATNVGMVVVHLTMMTGGFGSATGHAHGQAGSAGVINGDPTAAATGGTLMWAATALASAEAAAASYVLNRRRRADPRCPHRRPRG